jgi:type II secretion system protein G
LNKKGFTLIELLIVVAIIAILAAIAIPNFLAAQVRSKASRAKADLNTVALGMESYYVDNNAYPPVYDANNTMIPHDIRLSPITTPVAYVASLPKDVFQTGRLAWGSYANQQDVAQKQFDYWNFSYTSNKYYLDSVGPLLWRVSSVGPNGIFEISETYVSGNTYHYTTNNIYDPTNGTVSNGDIWRIGGSN